VSTGDQFEAYLWILLALALGGIIGLERELRGHEAGLRTTALVCGGAAIFGQVSNLYGDDRIAAGVVQGIGFLGAGLVVQRGRSVIGATTAATVWAVAAIGLVVAREAAVLAILITVTIVIALELAPASDWVLRTARARGVTHRESDPIADDPPAGQ